MKDYLIYIGQLSYLLTLCSYAIRNVNWLRGVAIAASIVAIYYSATASSDPLWIPILWNLAFITLNTIQLLLTKWRARAVSLDPIENFLSKTVLSNFPPAEVKSFASISGEAEAPAGQQIIRAGSELQHLFCITQGKVDILVNGQKTAELSAGYFLGEMSLLTRSPARADVLASENLKLLVWPHDAIEKWVDSDASRLTLLQTAMGTQVVDQLLRQNDALLSEMKERAVG